jgi:hypothetical protein
MIIVIISTSHLSAPDDKLNGLECANFARTRPIISKKFVQSTDFVDKTKSYKLKYSDCFIFWGDNLITEKYLCFFVPLGTEIL